MSPPEPASRAVAVILCAGQGTRMGAGQNKIFLPLLGRPMLVYSLEACQATPEVDELLLVAHPQEVERCREIVAAHVTLAKPLAIISGGASRHQSEMCALDHLRPRIASGEIALVLIHDGARPLIAVEDIRRLIAAARASGGALLATPVPSGERMVRATPDGIIAADFSAHSLWRAQTPQAFSADLLLWAYDQAQSAGFEGTDTAASFERAGLPVQVVAAQHPNLKVTTPEDLALAEQVLRERSDASHQ